MLQAAAYGAIRPAMKVSRGEGLALHYGNEAQP